MAADNDTWSDSPEWQAKTAFLPGLPDDLSALPRLRYQALEGRVYTLTVWRDGSTARGEVLLAELEALIGGPPRAGWYNALGEYLGQDPGLE